MFYLQKTELGHFNLYPGLSQGIEPKTLAGLSCQYSNWLFASSCQFIIGQQSALNYRGPGFDLNKNILPKGAVLCMHDSLL